MDDTCSIKVFVFTATVYWVTLAEFEFKPSTFALQQISSSFWGGAGCNYFINYISVYMELFVTFSGTFSSTFSQLETTSFLAASQIVEIRKRRRHVNNQGTSVFLFFLSVVMSQPRLSIPQPLDVVLVCSVLLRFRVSAVRRLRAEISTDLFIYFYVDSVASFSRLHFLHVYKRLLQPASSGCRNRLLSDFILL